MSVILAYYMNRAFGLKFDLAFKRSYDRVPWTQYKKSPNWDPLIDTSRIESLQNSVISFVRTSSVNPRGGYH